MLDVLATTTVVAAADTADHRAAGREAAADIKVTCFCSCQVTLVQDSNQERSQVVSLHACAVPDCSSWEASFNGLITACLLVIASLLFMHVVGRTRLYFNRRSYKWFVDAWCTQEVLA